MNISNFSHNGIHDTFTNLAAPNYFYEELTRLVSRYKRSQAEFRIINVSFVNITSGHLAEVLEMAAMLQTLLRGEDLAARLGFYEFGLLINGSEHESLALRIQDYWKKSLNNEILLNFKIGEPKKGFDALQLLNKMDENA